MDDKQTPQPLIRAAQYVRISAHQQKSSTDNQADANRKYAEKHGMEIVRTYTDGGEDGSVIGERVALEKMITDVRSGNADYKVILVYDFSRFGHNQDADQSAHREFICKKAGIQIEYTNESYKKDRPASSEIIQAVKRTMANEMLREILNGDGFFLKSDQLQVLREHLANVTAMLRLVSECALEKRDEIGLHQDVHAAMQLALGALKEMDQMIEENS